MADDGAGAVDAAADELYGLPLDRFTPRRAELAKAARTAGDKAAATEIAALRKPTVPAWLVNLLAREAPDDLGALLEVGEQLREAQSQLLGPRMKELSQQAHATVQGLSRRIAEIAESRDQAVTAAVDRDVEQTLRAALADPQAELAVASGRLTRALAYAGFGEVDVTAATATPLGRTTVRPGAGVRAGAEGRVAAGREAAGREAAADERVAAPADGSSAAGPDAAAAPEHEAVSAEAEPTTARLTSVGGRAAGGGRRDRTESGRGAKRSQAANRQAEAEADRAEAARARAEAARAEDAAARAELERATQAAEEAARAARAAEALVDELQERLAQARRDSADAVRAEDTARRTERRAARAAREAASALRMATRSAP